MIVPNLKSLDLGLIQIGTRRNNNKYTQNQVSFAATNFVSRKRNKLS
jgi:hypothetical protein